MHSLYLTTNSIYKTVKMNQGKPTGAFLKYTSMDSSYTIKCFYDAVISGQKDEALVYISKNYIDKINLAEIKTQLLGDNKLTHLVTANFKHSPRNCKTHTTLIYDKTSKLSKFIHIHMLHEPDKFAKWKIYSVEEEVV